MRKNKELLDSFIRYCKEHPEQRFWQALRNWSTFGYIFGSDSMDGSDLNDTFYREIQ